MAPTTDNSIWAQMNYVPPRGPCNFRISLMSGTCQCKRYMLHPLKALTSFECDGCGHHASFHSLENKQEDAVLKQWEDEAKEKGAQDAAERAGKKRKRAIEAPKNGASSRQALRSAGQREVIELPDEEVD